MDQLVFSNVNTYFDIIKTNYNFMIEDMEKRIRTKDNGEIGNVITFDYEQKSFKCALIIVVFVGIFLESILHMLLVQKIGLKGYTRKIDRSELKEKIRILGCNDVKIRIACDQYIIARKELVHEKAYTNQNVFMIAQDEAKKAVELMMMLIKEFRIEKFEKRMIEFRM